MDMKEFGPDTQMPGGEQAGHMPPYEAPANAEGIGLQQTDGDAPEIGQATLGVDTSIEPAFNAQDMPDLQANIGYQTQTNSPQWPESHAQTQNWQTQSATNAYGVTDSAYPSYDAQIPGQQAAMPAGVTAYYIPPQQTKKKMGAGKIVLIVVAVLVAFALFASLALGVFVVASISTFTMGVGGFSMLAAPPTGSFSVIDVQGTISYDSNTYNHAGTLEYIDTLMETENDKGILLFMNTPGGGVYEGSELYQALMEYREVTERPVWVYMGPICASAGYQISASAEHIVANANTTTGAIGVYIALQDISGLYDMLGVETVLIKAGEEKGAGLPGVPISDSQREMYQEQVDEYYDEFVSVVEQGRNFSHEQALALSDGSIYTGRMALENGLVDELGDWEDTLAVFEEQLGVPAYYPNISQPSYVAQVFGQLQSLMPQSDAQAVISHMESVPQGVPVSYASELADRAQLIDVSQLVS